MGSHRTTHRAGIGGGTNPTLERREGGSFESTGLLVPLTGIKEIGAAKYIFSVPPSDLLRLEVDGRKVMVCHQNKPIGWLVDPHDRRIDKRLREDREPTCSIHATWGDADEPRAIVVIRL